MNSSEKQQLVSRLVSLVGVSLVGILVMICGLGVAFGSRKTSLFGFFGALAMLGMLRLIIWRTKKSAGNDSRQ